MSLGKDGLAGLMKHFESLQSNIEAEQAQSAKREYTGQSGAGLVKVVMTGDYGMQSITLDESLTKDVAPEDQELLPDLIVAAVNDAINKIKLQSQEKFKELGQGMNFDIFKNLPK